MKHLIKIIAITLIVITFASEGNAQRNYDKAAGIRLGGWGYGISGKMFISETSAIEAMLNYRKFSYGLLDYSYSYSYMRITGLYEIHNQLGATDGLDWYYGGGAFVWISNYSSNYTGTSGGASFGISGVLGVEYTFENIPLNAGVDWVPSIGFGNNSGFLAGNGALTIRYTF